MLNSQATGRRPPNLVIVPVNAHSMAADQRRGSFRFLRRCVAIAFYIGCVGVIAMGVFSISSVFLFPFGFDSGPAMPDPPRDFKRLTGWTFPDDAQVLRAENTFSGFLGDGDYTLVVQTSPDRVAKWISASGSGTWKPCPIPAEIQEYCWQLPNHDGQLYRADKVMDTDDGWHRGSLVIVNPDTGMVWVYAWKT